MSQYRKKFLHHRITGKLLLRVTDAVLKVELGIGPLGHRSLILEGRQRLLHGDEQLDDMAAARYVRPSKLRLQCCIGKHMVSLW
jgi:hypothetical protein